MYLVNNYKIMRKMYRKPQTETTPIKVVNTLCASQQGTQPVGFGDGQGSGAALAPGRTIE